MDAAIAIDERSPQARPVPATRPKASGPRIWATGGGKGGVGKSVVTANLGLALARRGRRCAVIDLDLGGANLHTVLGVPNPHRTLGHFLSGKQAMLADVMCETPVPNLWMVSGSGGGLEVANLKHFQKQKLLRHLRGLDVDDVLLDLGAGSSFNVLDFFLVAERGIMVISPEPTSVENAYHFLKSAFYRWLRKTAKETPVRAAIEEALDNGARRQIRSPRELIAAVMKVDPAAGELLIDRAKRFRPMLIVNQVRKPAHRSLGREFDDACRSFLGTGLDYLGCLEWDPCVGDALTHRQPVLSVAPSCPFSLELDSIVERMQSEDAAPAASPSANLRPGSGSERAPYDPTSLATYGMLTHQERVARFEVRRNQAPRPASVPALAPSPATQPADRGDLPPLDVSRPGAYLKRCRETRGLSINDLAEQTRIRGAHFESIEGELYHKLPPEPYVRGFILQYARVLGIAGAEALAESFAARYRKALATH